MQQITDTAALLDDLDAGIYSQKIARAMADTASAVVSTGKKGKVTLSFDIKRIGDSQQVQITHAVKFSRPTEKGSVVEDNTTTTPMHVGPRGKLSIMPDTQLRIPGMNQPAQNDAEA